MRTALRGACLLYYYGDKQNGIESAPSSCWICEKTGRVEARRVRDHDHHLRMRTSAMGLRTETPLTKGCLSISHAGDYRFSICNAHEAANNILAAQGKITANGNTAEGNAANVKILRLGALTIPPCPGPRTKYRVEKLSSRTQT